MIALGAALLCPGPAYAEDYPSWAEVEAAKADVSTREAEANRLTAYISDLEVEAGRLGDAAVAAAARAADAEARRVAQAQRTAALETAATNAENAATESSAQFGRAASLLARTGGADSVLRIVAAAVPGTGGAGPDRVLADLARASRVADLFGGLAERAATQRAAAAATRDQARIAASERGRLAQEAADASAAAQAAHEAAEAALAAQRATLDTLYAQLASLRDRSVDLERRFQIGEQARREAEAREAAASEAEAAGGGGLSTAPPPPGVVVDPAGAKAYARSAIGRYGWGGDQFRCLDLLWTRESSWRADAYNRSSGAYGIPQSLPGSKMAAAGADWRTNAATQIEWGLSYISGRYGSPCGAWAHSEAYNWY
ncbi:lytic transglycosylase domain-containing protein [Agromyces protaetiae]|uniref:Lytic transglycosylase domain-containing protein n=1 Tax=Agromyces protaetiae TaxID=2509455 RepID=A0A4P6FDZ0_9MICO|nr:lytic transglycosylase domain-containing protein [Agromyces protaetiae]QAY73996.1 lytic transglycosylase domain-containing protein [Agromyces protaetiae]